MSQDRQFTMSEAEARRIRRGAWLPAVLILPMAAMFGFDQSKSQPMHFLMVFSVAVILSAAVVSISWHGAKRRIEEFSRTSLKLVGDKMVWVSSLGKTEIRFADIIEIQVTRVRGSVRSIALRREGAGKILLEGYERMDVLAEQITALSDCPATETNSIINI